VAEVARLLRVFETMTNESGVARSARVLLERYGGRMIWNITRASAAVTVLGLWAGCSGHPPSTAAGVASPLSMAVGHAMTQRTESAAVAAPIAPDRKATTVAAVWKARTALAGTQVTLRGKVVKYNGGILGVNWIHLQDGSGNAADGSNDITVTSESACKVGDVISVTGTVAIDKDLGAGYKYPVIIERATISVSLPSEQR
jgi:hypothetical protein